MKIAHWRRARQVIQALALAFFLGLAVYSWRSLRSPSPAGIPLRLDPLAALAAMLAERRWLTAFIPALVLVAASILLGRFWCGWLCPLGTLIDWISPRHLAGTEPAPSSRWRSVKYALLFVTLFAALWGNLTLLFLDPLTIFLRSVSTLLLPALNWLITQAEITLYRVVFLRGALEALDALLRSALLSYKQPHYGGAVLFVLFLGGILALGLVARRAWCRYLCPLGGMIAFISKASWLKRRVSDSCVSCGACARHCPMGTIDADKGYASDSGECTLCLDCAPVCPKGAISFGGDWRVDRGWSYDPSRRQALGALGASLAGLALLKLNPRAHHPDPHRLRPPGAKEESLLSSCIRCGACLHVCPTHGLQPSLIQTGLEGLGTPILVPRLGHCEYSCTACGNTCPTGAIPRLSQPEKLEHPIGKAYIDPKICIPWSGRGDCIVCEEMCPLPQKAIFLRETSFTDNLGEVRTFLAPIVLHERCIGCGLCESKCPVNGEAAIRVVVDPMS
jgi:polyferredoxin